MQIVNISRINLHLQNLIGDICWLHSHVFIELYLVRLDRGVKSYIAEEQIVLSVLNQSFAAQETMEDPIAIDLNVPVGDVGISDLLEIQSTLCHLLVCLDDIDLLRACIVKPVAAA